MSFMLLSTLMECIIPRVNPNVNYGLWMIICQCSFISYTKTCVGNVDNERGYVRVASLVTQTGKESACNAGGLGSISRLG